MQNNEVHVWRAYLDVTEGSISYLEDTLDANERERAERFQFPEHRSRFICAHGALREILGRYLALQPTELRFSYGRFGKPALAAQPKKRRLSFNMSHAHQIALYAVVWDRDIGIDLEHHRPILEADQIVERNFSAREKATFGALPANKKQDVFLKYWTRKEAFVKAVGGGLSLPLDRIDVTAISGEHATLLSTIGQSASFLDWSLRDIEPSPHYSAAVAVRSREWQLKCWQWRDNY
jgi:4'-phosphopantetheinyl transferase